ncbi:MAG: LysM peptidoglycan-binding domain-containing protein [Anaerolineaceae bacterium]
MTLKKQLRLGLLLILIIMLAACQPENGSQIVDTFGGGTLTPFFTVTQTLTITPTPIYESNVTIQPTLTSTPQIYTLKSNDTLWTIAAKASLSVNDLLAANPGINAYSLTAGMKIVIPASSGSAATETTPSSTPIPLKINEPICTPSLTGGLYCFAIVENGQTFMVQNISAQFTLTDPQDGTTQFELALLPLNHLTSGSSLPLFAYFPPPVKVNFQLKVELLSALADDETNSTFLGLNITNMQVSIAADGLTAVVNGSVSAASAASRYWLAAVAYDSQGEVVAIRQLDNNNGLNAGESVGFTMNVYSSAGKIETVSVFGEAAK